MSHNNYILTGSSGFLGSIVKETLVHLGYQVISLGRAESAGVKVDISSPFSLPNSLNAGVVVHVAGKAHMVPRTKDEEQQFFDVNFEGTKNLCNALEKLANKPKAFIFISSVAVYGLDKGQKVTESHSRNGNTPYAKSKILAEEWLESWAKQHDIILGILRLPLIAGLKPPGNLGAMINGIKKGMYVGIGESEARRSLVWAEDVASIIPVLAKVGGIYNLTDGYHPSFKELENTISLSLHKRKPLHIPLRAAKAIAGVGDLFGSRSPITSYKLNKMISTLTFDDSKARDLLGWNPSSVLQKLPTVL